eukprot:TRINITY_DN1960_c0_g1_i2.p1 TRINITY_DN1960_c0_g1~~TRINITY_DN1960_c0_g1_i2.p1  ORF type:complete len:260 (+),score=32.99 TRINITY_DN1960_c0_g1_i2:110-889(+)
MAKVCLRCKVAVLGEAAVGKSALIQMFNSKGHKFPRTYNMTLGAEFSLAELQVDQDKSVVRACAELDEDDDNAPDAVPRKDTVQLFIMDIAGQEIYEEQVKGYLDGTAFFMFVYDVASKDSFDALNRWHKLAADYVGGAEKVAGVLVANKTDIEAARVQVPELMGENFAKRHKLRFVAASAQRGVEVDTAFVHLAQKFHEVRPGVRWAVTRSVLDKPWRSMGRHISTGRGMSRAVVLLCVGGCVVMCRVDRAMYEFESE